MIGSNCSDSFEYNAGDSRRSYTSSGWGDRKSSLLAGSVQMEMSHIYPTAVPEQDPAEFSAVPPNYPMMKQDRFLINR